MQELQIQEWSQGLVDLAGFGIVVRPNPNHSCWKCGQSTSGWTDGYGIDNLCRHCGPTLPARWQEQVYTPQTVRFSDENLELKRYINPIPDRFLQKYDQLGVVVIQGYPLIVHCRLHMADLYDPYTGECVMAEALRITSDDRLRLSDSSRRRPARGQSLELLAGSDLTEQLLEVNWVRQLCDLSTMNIIVRPSPPRFCVRCLVTLHDSEYGYGLDSLCEKCWPSRREEAVFTPETIRVSVPVTFKSGMRVIWNGVLQDPHYQALLGVVVIEGQPHLVKSTTCDMAALYNFNGQLIDSNALYLSARHMAGIFSLQAAL